MANTPAAPVVLLATIAGGVAAAALASRGISAAGRYVLHELDYRAGHSIETWVRSLR